jgi:hypothetical protein
MNKRPLLISLISLAILAVIIAVALSLSARQKEGNAVDQSQEPGMDAHTVSDEQKEAILNDAKKAIDVLGKTRDETAALGRYFDSPLLDEIIGQVESEKAEGRVKIRRLKNVKVTLANFTRDVAGVTLIYTDESYYVDELTGHKITEPTGTRERRALALRESDDTWKIYRSLAELKPDSGTEETTGDN